MSATNCMYCLRESDYPGYHGPCNRYLLRLLCSPDRLDRERADYLIDTALRHATNRFMGRSD